MTTSLYINGSRDIIIFLDGPPGVGKSKISNIIVDSSSYIHEMISCKKARSLYEQMMFVDYTVMLCELNRNSYNFIEPTIATTQTDRKILVNRSIFSSFIHSIFFKYDGHKIHPEIFRQTVDTNIFNSSLITKVHQNWLRVLNSHSSYLSNYQYRLLWIIPENIDEIVNSIKTSEYYNVHGDQIDWRLYCENYMYLFKKFAKTTKFGDILTIDGKITRQDIENYYQYNSENYEYFLDR